MRVFAGLDPHQVAAIGDLIGVLDDVEQHGFPTGAVAVNERRARAGGSKRQFEVEMVRHIFQAQNSIAQLRGVFLETAAGESGVPRRTRADPVVGGWSKS